MSTEPNIKYRVTGAIVLIALAIIFLPLILDGQKKNQILDSNIPDKPVIGEIILLNIQETENAQVEKKQQTSNEQKSTSTDKTKAGKTQSSNVSQTDVSDKSTKSVVKPVVKSVVKPVVKPKPKPTVTKPAKVKTKPPTVVERTNRPKYKASAYVIQLGSFSNQFNANKIVDKLKAAGFKAYLKKGQSNGNVIYRVLVGPVIERKKAEAQINKLNKLSGLKAIILSYDPLRH